MFADEILIDIAREILKGYALPPGGIHGIAHWGRVVDNGLRLAAQTGAKPGVVQLFGLFHDCRRLNDDHDPRHGARGAALAGELNGGLFTLAPAELALLQDACTRHTRGLTEADITVETCWDADRLDLPRVNIFTVPERLCTAPAREPAFIQAARRRSLANHITPLALALTSPR
jgi:uncharacterized protein